MALVAQSGGIRGTCGRHVICLPGYASKDAVPWASRAHPARPHLCDQSALTFLTPLHPTTSPLLHEGHPLSDHDLVSVGILPWEHTPPPPMRCQGWGTKHIRKFQAHCATFVPSLQCSDMDALPCTQQISLMHDLHAHMLLGMEKVNDHHPVKVQHGIPEWASHVKSLLRLSRRNPKLFFRRVRHSGLAPMRSPQPPMDPNFLKSLVQ